VIERYSLGRSRSHLKRKASQARAPSRTVTTTRSLPFIVYLQKIYVKYTLPLTYFPIRRLSIPYKPVTVASKVTVTGFGA
jgi:hypothetical protein